MKSDEETLDLKTVGSEEAALKVKADLQRWYCDRLGLADAQITAFDIPFSGVVNETYLHTVEYLDNKKPKQVSAVLRLQPRDSKTPIPDVDVNEQAFVLKALSHIEGLLTPKILWAESDGAWLGRAFYIMEKMPGQAVFDENIAPSTEPQLSQMYDQALEALVKIHAVDWQQAGLEAIFPGYPQQSPLRAQLKNYRRHLTEASGGKHYKLFEDAYDWLMANIPQQTLPVLNWGDARIGNMLFDGTRLTGVLDWEIAEITSREVDIGWFTFFEGYLPKDESWHSLSTQALVKSYQQKAGVELVDLDYFERWAAFRLSVMRLRAGRYAIESGEQPATSNVCEVNFATVRMAQLFGFEPPE